LNGAFDIDVSEDVLPFPSSIIEVDVFNKKGNAKKQNKAVEQFKKFIGKKPRGVDLFKEYL